MAGITIRNLDGSVKSGLRVQAAMHGWSMEEEVREILRRAIIKNAGEKGLGSFICHTFAEAGCVEYSTPNRSIPRRCDLFEDEL